MSIVSSTYTPPPLLSGAHRQTLYASLNGFRNADAYYRAASSKPLLSDISVPTLLVNAANDPFLSETCYPRTAADSALMLEVPESGGHVGFVSFTETDDYWSERRAASFLATTLQVRGREGRSDVGEVSER